MVKECPDKYRQDVFEEAVILVPWVRVRDFQLVMMRLIAEQILLHTPEYSSRRRLDLYIPGEISRTYQSFPKPAVLYESKHNEGAHEVAAALKDVCPQLTLLHETPDFEALPKLNRSANFIRGKRTGMLAQSEVFKAQLTLTQPTHMLLYLNRRTFEGEGGEALTIELRYALSVGLPIVLVHECDTLDSAKGACDFGDFFTMTPDELVSAGIYKPLAIAWYPGRYRLVSIKLLLISMGAKTVSKKKALGSGAASRSSVMSEDKMRSTSVAGDLPSTPRLLGPNRSSLTGALTPRRGHGLARESAAEPILENAPVRFHFGARKLRVSQVKDSSQEQSV